MKTEADSLERIIAEMRQPENSGQFGPWQFTADNIKDWAGRLAALAKAREVTDADVETEWVVTTSCAGTAGHPKFATEAAAFAYFATNSQIPSYINPSRFRQAQVYKVRTETTDVTDAALATFTEGESLRHVDHPDCNHCYSLWADKQEGEE